METVINLGIPHVGEQIFKSLSTKDLLQFLEVSQDWRVLAENVLFLRFKGKLFEACRDGKTEIVRIILDHSKNEDLEQMLMEHFMPYFYTTFGGFKQTALLAACYPGHKEVVRLILAHPSSSCIDFNAKHNALRLAIEKGHIGIVKLLQDHQIKANNFVSSKNGAKRLCINQYFAT